MSNIYVVVSQSLPEGLEVEAYSYVPVPKDHAVNFYDSANQLISSFNNVSQVYKLPPQEVKAVKNVYKKTEHKQVNFTDYDIYQIFDGQSLPDDFIIVQQYTATELKQMLPGEQGCSHDNRQRFIDHEWFQEAQAQATRLGLEQNNAT